VRPRLGRDPGASGSGEAWPQDVILEVHVGEGVALELLARNTLWRKLRGMDAPA